ncbi:MAG TPA: glycosyltransferase family 4 protein [Stellaceae bacterium]|nr:glycosyltransferase family 4 protein [Stellaceae bacterium]
MLLTPTRPIAVAPLPTPAARPKLLFLATEDWYFWSDRLPFARALRDAGCDIVVAAREQGHGARIRGEGFALLPLAWRRRGDGILDAARALRAIVRIYRRERPSIVNHIALKPILFGGIARRAAFAGHRQGCRPVAVNWVMGLGIGFAGATPAARLRRRLLGWALRLTASGPKDRIVVQNPDDGALLARLGIEPARIVLIRGSGVDSAHFTPLPQPAGPTVTVALVGRLLRSKGVVEAVEAVRRLRAEGRPVELVLAGAPDPDSRDSLDEGVLAGLAGEPGIEWLGRVEDVRTVWRRAAIAVLPSTYGEGLPRALLEAAACARPIIASDVPGCREVVCPGVTGLLVPPGDVAALAASIAALADDPARRQAMGLAARALVERELSLSLVACQTMTFYLELLGDEG